MRSRTLIRRTSTELSGRDSAALRRRDVAHRDGGTTEQVRRLHAKALRPRSTGVADSTAVDVPVPLAMRLTPIDSPRADSRRDAAVELVRTLLQRWEMHEETPDEEVLAAHPDL